MACTVILLAGSLGFAPASAAPSWGGGSAGHACSRATVFCTEIASPYEKAAFGNTVVGHDEPSILYYSNKAGSGNSQRYTFKLPTDPPPSPIPGRSYTFELMPTFWFGMAMCADQSAPNPGRPCKADSNSNITSNLSRSPGGAYMEMQFYPPGWAPLPESAGISCTPTQWCAALTIDSLAENSRTGAVLNKSCQNAVGLEYINYAFITKDGVPQGAPNPLQATAATDTPNPAQDLMMNPGDTVVLRMHDTSSGLRVDIKDVTTGQSGFMVASAANNFGQIAYAPAPSTACVVEPYNFHPMYSTSTVQTRVLWAAHSYNVAFDAETGHFDLCQGSLSNAPVPLGNPCPSDAFEAPNALSWSDYDDTTCAPASVALLVKISGCTGANYGFDGLDYLPDWPDGNTKLHPTPILTTSPTFGPKYKAQYSQVGFEIDTPRIENTNYCNRLTTGSGCPRVPLTDDGVPAAFYPFFSAVKVRNAGCYWALGNKLPGGKSFGGVAQYKSIVALTYLVGGKVVRRYNDYRGTLPNNPCPAT